MSPEEDPEPSLSGRQKGCPEDDFLQPFGYKLSAGMAGSGWGIGELV